MTAKTPCPNKNDDCVAWDPEYIWVAPGWTERVVVLAALPAFAVGVAVVRGLGRLGVSEVLSFMTTMPVLLFAWYYGIGWLVDRYARKRKS